MSTLTLTQVGPTAFECKTENWSVRIDTPLSKGGTGTGPTPSELTAIALAACKAMTVAKWSQNKNLNVQNITAEVSFNVADDTPRRISDIDVALKNVRSHVPADLHPRLEAAVDACIV